MKNIASMDKNTPKIAVLVDTENISVEYTEVIMKELNDYGTVTIRRAYGDWSSDNLKKWRSSANKYAFHEVHISSNTKGKNSSDIGVVINAMDLLYTQDVDIFCIVSSDSDFTKLNLRIRESNKFVIGMGEKSKSNPALTSSCNRFIYLEDLLDKYDYTMQSKQMTQEELVQDTEVLFTIRRLVNNISQETGDVHLGDLKNRLIAAIPDFSTEKYGYDKFANFLKAFGIWEFDKRYRHIVGYKD